MAVRRARGARSRRLVPAPCPMAGRRRGAVCLPAVGLVPVDPGAGDDHRGDAEGDPPAVGEVGGEAGRGECGAAGGDGDDVAVPDEGVGEEVPPPDSVIDEPETVVGQGKGWGGRPGGGRRGDLGCLVGLFERLSEVFRVVSRPWQSGQVLAQSGRGGGGPRLLLAGGRGLRRGVVVPGWPVWREGRGQSMRRTLVFVRSLRFTLVLWTKMVKSSLWSGLMRTSTSGRPSRARASGPV